MELKKGYKQTEVGVIPKDWNIDSIKNLAIVKTGSKNTQDRIENGEYPFFVRSQTVERINSYSFDGEAVLTAGDGVGVGKVMHYIKGKFDCHQRVYRISGFASNLNGYFFYLYFSNNFLNRIMQMTAKSSVDSIRMEMIADMQVPVPPTKDEQTAIAIALSDTDALISSLQKLIEKKRAIKQGAMQQLLKPKEGWVEKKLNAVGEIVTGSTPPTGNKEYWDGAIPWITPTDINAEKDIYNSEREITTLGLQVIRKLPPNTLLVTCIASIGKNAILRVSGASNQQINAIIPYDEFDADFLYYLIGNNKKFLLRNAGITATLMISKMDFAEILFSIPKTKAEQTSIAEILSDMDNEISALQVKLLKCQMLKQGMMQDLLTGKTRLI